MYLIDSHCHLNRLDTSTRSIADYLIEARSHHIAHFLSICVDLAEMPTLLKIAADFPDVSLAAGQHPNDLHDAVLDVEALQTYAEHAAVVAIGETGLDYFHGDEASIAKQKISLRQHIEIAKSVGKPLVIHTRNARADTLAILREEKADSVGGVLHCFTEDWEMAKAAMDLGFYISFSGIVTFKNATELQAVAKQVPLDRMLIETDSPYLAPMPYRGKQNEPAYVRYVAAAIASLRGETLDSIAEQTTVNFFKLFKIKESL
jgi:TatD DNase family protein